MMQESQMLLLDTGDLRDGKDRYPNRLPSARLTIEHTIESRYTGRNDCTHAGFKLVQAGSSAAAAVVGGMFSVA